MKKLFISVLFVLASIVSIAQVEYTLEAVCVDGQWYTVENPGLIQVYRDAIVVIEETLSKILLDENSYTKEFSNGIITESWKALVTVDELQYIMTVALMFDTSDNNTFFLIKKPGADNEIIYKIESLK